MTRQKLRKFEFSLGSLGFIATFGAILLNLCCCLAAAVGDGLLHAGERILERSDESDLPRSRSDGKHGEAGLSIASRAQRVVTLLTSWCACVFADGAVTSSRQHLP